LVLAGCRHQKPPTAKPKETFLGVAKAVSQRTGDEIVVCGQLFDTGAPVVLWTDPGGYDMYAPRTVERSTTRPAATRPRHFNLRTATLTDTEVDRVRREGWTLPLLQRVVDQFVIHYDVAGVSRTCFNVLKERGLGVQFMLDIDGTIYQTMDLQESAAHATKANSRSVGVEIANVGAYSGSSLLVKQWYKEEPDGSVRITVPERFKGGGVRTPNFVGGPARAEMVSGMIQGANYRQYDYTPQQYDSLIKLTAALCTVFPKMQCDYPRQKTALGSPAARVSEDKNDPMAKPSAVAAPWEDGVLIPHALTWEQYDIYQGLLGHYHVQTDKQDPGPAFQWDGVIRGARARMSAEAVAWNRKLYGQPAKAVASTNPTSRPSRGRWRGRNRSASTTRATTQATQPAEPAR
jgi:N-acetyl-anhydromuramyl-L-alanine amidase AmpD